MSSLNESFISINPEGMYCNCTVLYCTISLYSHRLVPTAVFLAPAFGSESIGCWLLRSTVEPLPNVNPFPIAPILCPSWSRCRRARGESYHYPQAIWCVWLCNFRKDVKDPRYVCNKDVEAEAKAEAKNGSGTFY